MDYIRWSAIAARLPGRTDNEIKNHWNTHIRKRLERSGIDPVTHSPRLDLLDFSSLLAALFNHQPNFLSDSPSAINALSLLNPDVLRLASLLLPPQQPLQIPNPIHASNFDQNLQTPVTSGSSQPLTECTTPTNNETTSFEPINARLDDVSPAYVLPPLSSESFDIDSLMSTPKSSPQQNSTEAETNSSSFLDFAFPENFIFDDFAFN